MHNMTGWRQCRDMRILAVALALWLLMPTPAYAIIALVKDVAVGVNTTTRNALAQIYEKLTVAYWGEQLGMDTKQLAELQETLKQAQETYNRLTDVYKTAKNVYNAIGDPMKLASYLNSEFVKSSDIDNLLGIARMTMNADVTDINFDYARSIVSKADAIIGADQYETQAEINAENAKVAAAVEKVSDEMAAKLRDGIKELEEKAKGLTPQGSTLNELMHANYQTNQYIAQRLTADAAVQAQALKMEKEKRAEEVRDRQDALKNQAQSVIAANDMAEAAGKYREKGSLTEGVYDLYKRMKSSSGSGMFEHARAEIK